MIEHHHGAYLHRHDPELIAKVLRVKQWQFNSREEVRDKRKRK